MILYGHCLPTLHWGVIVLVDVVRDLRCLKYNDSFIKYKCEAYLLKFLVH